MAVVRSYFELTTKYQEEYGDNTILLMQVGSFFEVYGLWNEATQTMQGSRIHDFSRICELNIVQKNMTIEENRVWMAGFKDMQLDKYIQKIQSAGFTAVVYIQDEETIHTDNPTRSLAGIFSSGTYFQTETAQLTNSTSCIWIEYVESKVLHKGKHVVIGVANLDIYTGKTTIFQCSELYANNPTTYDELERFISTHNPSEVIFIANLPHGEKEINQVLGYIGVNSTLVHRWDLVSNLISEKKKNHFQNCEKQVYQREILSKFYSSEGFERCLSLFQDHHVATQAFCYLLDFMYQHSKHLVRNIAEPVFEVAQKRLTLANHSLKQLNLLNDGSVKTSRYSSVSDLLNHCLTPMGKRRFQYELLHPICDMDVLQREYDITEHLLARWTELAPLLKTQLTPMKDLSKLERQVFGGKISPRSFVHLHATTQRALQLFQQIQTDDIFISYLGSVADNLEEVCADVLQFIEKHFVLDVAKEIDQWQAFEQHFISEGVDEDLDRKSRLLYESEQGLEAVRDCFNRLLMRTERKTKNGSTDYVKIYETDKHHFSLMCTKLRCKALEEVLPSVSTTVSLSLPAPLAPLSFQVSKTQFSFEKQSSSNMFITDKQIETLCKNITLTKLAMKECVGMVYKRIVEDFGTSFQRHIERIAQFVTLVDILYAKAYIAHTFHYCKPTLNRDASKSCVQITGLRHALIEQFDTSELYVTNDLSLGEGGTNGILLFGTNAVGKTTLIRALGIAVILAQAGLYVPCTTFVYKPYKHIFTRILGNDNLFKGLSTFEVEMSELRTIFRLMDAHSLILGDELCSGTETISAISIFVAGIQRMTKAGSSFIFATHLHEIVHYEEVQSLTTVALKHMEVVYNKEIDALVYNRKLKDGSGSNVYGLEVCKSLHLPADFLQSANEIRMKYNTEDQSMLSLKTSRYNANKIVHLCERCGTQMGTEVHHLQPQVDADEKGVIRTEDATFHKNHLANLMTVCEACHQFLHKEQVKQKRVKTTHRNTVVNIPTVK